MLSSSSMSAAATGSVRADWRLQREHELRCEIPENASLTLKLLTGNAEIFGIEMAPSKEYTFKGQNLAVFTWHGCSLESVSSSKDVYLYQVESTPMPAYVNTHIQLEARRDIALGTQCDGPRVIIVGPQDSGKTTLANILTSYAARLDRTPILVDLDVGQSMVSISGAMSAIPVDKTNLNIEEGLSNINPLVYFYGHNSPQDNIEHYKLQVSILAEQVQRRLAIDLDARSSGIIINTCGWIDAAGFDVILHIIRAFAVDIVLVMNQDKLYSNLVSTFEQPTWLSDGFKRAVVKLPASGGVVTRDADVRKRYRRNKIKEYFYGRLQNFNPERRDAVNISNYVLLRVGGARLTQGMQIVQHGDHTQDTSCTLIRIEATADLSYCVAAVLHGGIFEANGGEVPDASFGEVSQELLKSNVAGYVTILDITPAENRMNILSPSPGALPSKYLLIGSVKWMD